MVDTVRQILELFTLDFVDLGMIFVSMFLFFTLWKILERVFFSRYLALIDRREELTIGGLDTASKSIDEAEKISTDVQRSLADKRKQLRDESSEVLGAAREKAAELIQSVEKDVNQRMNTARMSAAKLSTELTEKLGKEADQLEKMIIERVSL